MWLDYACGMRSVYLLWALAFLQGCAGLESGRANSGEAIKGVAYYMPMRYFLLTVEREGGATKKAEWSVTDVFPDVSQPYYLKYNPHLIGKTETSIEVNKFGLLGSATTKVSDSAAALSTVVKAPGFSTKGIIKEKEEQQCGDAGTTVFVVDGPRKGRVCADVDYDLSPLPSSKILTEKTSFFVPNAGADGGVTSGVFYKQERPYIAEAATKNGVSSKIVLAANNSPVMLLPYARTLFSANDGQVTFDNGMPTKYTQSTDGEFVALLKIPAAILSAYFAAIGNVFNAFSSREADEQSLALQRYKIAVAEHKLEKCKQALEADDKDAMTALGCDDLASP